MSNNKTNPNIGAVAKNGSEPNYHAIDPPKDKDPEEYHYTERRAAIFQMIRSRGNPYALPTQTELADRFGCSQGSISKDMDKLREFVAGNLGTNAKMTTRAIYERAVRDLMDDGDFEAAFDIVMKWNDWLQDIGAQEEAPDKLQANITKRQAARETEDYVLVDTDDDTIDLDGDAADALPEGISIDEE